MPESTQSQTQQLLQNLTGVQTQAQPSGAAGAINNGNPGTVYNVPPQTDAAGNWWNPPAAAMNPLIAGILNSTHGRYQPGAVPLPGTGGGTHVGIPTQQPTAPLIPQPRTGRGGGQWMAGGHFGDEYLGGMCVGAGMYLEGNIKAGNAVVGLVATTHTPEEGFDLHAIEKVSPPVMQPCVLLVTESGAMLVCSVSTPFTMVGAQSDSETIMAPAMQGEFVYVKRGKKTKIEKVISVLDAKEQYVVPISFGGRSFPAGADPKVLIYSHNMVKDDEANVTGTVYGFGDTGMSGSLNLSGSIDQSNMGNGYGYIPLPNAIESATAPSPSSIPATPVDPAAPWGRDRRGLPLPPPHPGATDQPNGFFQQLMSQLVPHDADGTVDWQGLFLESLIGPASSLINTTGAPRP